MASDHVRFDEWRLKHTAERSAHTIGSSFRFINIGGDNAPVGMGSMGAHVLLGPVRSTNSVLLVGCPPVTKSKPRFVGLAGVPIPSERWGNVRLELGSDSLHYSLTDHFLLAQSVKHPIFVLALVLHSLPG